MKEKKWVSFHIYYKKDCNVVLTKLVEPFISTRLKSGLIHNFFFIRYGDSDLHIRLRIFVNTDYILSIKKELQASILDFNSLSFDHLTMEQAVYNPEFNRYGGSQAIIIAEDQFHICSQIILELLKDRTNMDLQMTMYLSLSMQIAIVPILELDPKQQINFFKFLYEHFVQSNSLIVEREYKKTLPEHNDFSQKLLPKLVYIVSHTKELKKWQQKMLSIYQELMKLKKLHLLEEPHCGFKQKLKFYSAENYTLYHIFASYIHMLNNRLGITNKTEGYIYYLLSASM